MPKVQNEYLQGKREQILDAAYRVSMQKPVYSITMRDIITETGWSQGAIYRYFKNVHSILFELINRQTAHIEVREEVDTILALPEVPERIIAKIMDLITRTSMMNINEYGKMILEYSSLIATQPEYLEPFYQNVRIPAELYYLQKRTFEYVVSQVETGYFHPLMPVEDIFAFIETSIDGIERDLVLVQCCKGTTDNYSMLKELDPQKLMSALCKSVICLLGGDPEK